jgi:undecaprenyl diphosphate synthase
MSVMPNHVAIIMDGNGRWASLRDKPRSYGHQKGAEVVHSVIESAIRHEIKLVSLFALSSENFTGRPNDEVSDLMDLFSYMLDKNQESLRKEGVCLRFVGDFSVFSDSLVDSIRQVEQSTSMNTRLTLVVALNYSGRWDIAQAVRSVLMNGCDAKALTEEAFSQYLCMGEYPDPDLLIRTGGDSRVSNFMLWQLAYTELHFTPVLWPDFDASAFAEAVKYFKGCKRRFGMIEESV